MSLLPRKPLPPAIEIPVPGVGLVPATSFAGEGAGQLRRISGLTLAVLLLALVAGCASDGKPDRPAGHRWYQGDMDNDERSFFLDSFSDRN